MLHFHKFRQDLFAPQPAKDIYRKLSAGKGWPEECPPVRAASSFGWDVLANFDVTFIRKRDGTWKVEKDLVIESDFNWSNDDESDGAPLVQQYAWFWQRGQTIPHPISDNVFETIKDQVKVSSFLYLKSDPNELLFMTGLPNQWKAWRTWSAVVDTDWYPASYPWHVVLELDPRQKRITIEKGEPICRIIPLRRDTYFAQQMTPDAFTDFFDRGQQWLGTHGRAHDDSGTMDITHTYSRQQIKSRFVVME